MGREFSVIPERFPHTTDSREGTICKWEYLLVDVEGFLKKNCETPVQAEKMIRRINSRALFLNNCASHSRYFSDELDAQFL